MMREVGIMGLTGRGGCWIIMKGFRGIRKSSGIGETRIGTNIRASGKEGNKWRRGG